MQIMLYIAFTLVVTVLMINAHLIDTDTCEIDVDLVQTAFCFVNEWCEQEFPLFGVTSILSPAPIVGISLLPRILCKCENYNRMSCVISGRTRTHTHTHTPRDQY